MKNRVIAVKLTMKNRFIHSFQNYTPQVFTIIHLWTLQMPYWLLEGAEAGVKTRVSNPAAEKRNFTLKNILQACSKGNLYTRVTVTPAQHLSGSL